MVDTEMDEKDEEEVKKVEKKNEQSEGHGKMYNALSGIKEGKVIKMNESTLRRVVDRVIKEQGQGQGGTMSPEEFEKMLGASARYNKYHDSIESNIKANYTAINNMAGAIDKNFNVIGKILQGLHKGKKVGAQFIQNTLLAMGLANMVKK